MLILFLQSSSFWLLLSDRLKRQLIHSWTLMKLGGNSTNHSWMLKCFSFWLASSCEPTKVAIKHEFSSWVRLAFGSSFVSLFSLLTPWIHPRDVGGPSGQQPPWVLTQRAKSSASSRCRADSQVARPTKKSAKDQFGVKIFSSLCEDPSDGIHGIWAFVCL